ncbi:MAG TPA: hypothetical protein VFL97_10185, partial [Nitrococcus sp.]|nr:hypothetical protein [Nitrococcus sp.]
MNQKQARPAWHPQGVSGWLQPGAYGAAEQFFDEARGLRADHLRLAITATHWGSEDGRAWVRWLAGNAAKSFGLTIALYRQMPAVAPALPPVRASEAAAYYQLVQELGHALADHGEWLELADPLGPPVWPAVSSTGATLLNDLRLPGGLRLCLGGLPLDPAWVEAARVNGVLGSAAALAFCYWPPEQDVSFLLNAVIETVGAHQTLPLWLTPERLPARAVEQGRLRTCVGDCARLIESAADRVYFPLRPAPTPQRRPLGGPATGTEVLMARLLREDGQALRNLRELLAA